MTHFINYGPEPPAQPRHGRRLLAWCLFWIAFYACVGIGGLIGIQLSLDTQPVQGAEVDVTTTVTPAPASGTPTPGGTGALR